MSSEIDVSKIGTGGKNCCVDRVEDVSRARRQHLMVGRRIPAALKKRKQDASRSGQPERGLWRWDDSQMDPIDQEEDDTYEYWNVHLSNEEEHAQGHSEQGNVGLANQRLFVWL